MKRRQELLKEKYEEVVAMLKAQNIDMNSLQPLSRGGSRAFHEKEDAIATLSRTVHGLMLKRRKMQRAHERQAAELQSHVKALTQRISALTQQQAVLKMEANQLSQQIHEQETRFPGDHKAAASPPRASYAHVLPRVYSSRSGASAKGSASSAKYRKGDAISRSKSVSENKADTTGDRTVRSGQSAARSSNEPAAGGNRRRSSAAASTKKSKTRSRRKSSRLGDSVSSSGEIISRDNDAVVVADAPDRDSETVEGLKASVASEDEGLPAGSGASAEVPLSPEQQGAKNQSFPSREDEPDETQNRGNGTPATDGIEAGTAADLQLLARQAVEQAEQSAIYKAQEVTAEELPEQLAVAGVSGAGEMGAAAPEGDFEPRGP
ncbi:hypothetical protein BESB_063500 [Besnoitia besnoiti]|uniref:Uncharacterized protein n=1 Tax=Besnoitia besnoiti TaxID=94643 RepID=A0A2A9MIJ8_BESBE|nr:hypothetical protein BESB_063500 [Besnoitia besnoiti]PFH35463.1 hypothetical protein BESB_063500 [Besnoitia besnoiti]